MFEAKSRGHVSKQSTIPLFFRPNAPRFDGPGRSEAEAWVSRISNGPALKGRESLNVALIGHAASLRNANRSTVRDSQMKHEFLECERLCQ